MFLTKTAPTFKTVLKDQLFYGQWKYSFSFYLHEAHCLRDLNHENIDLKLDWIKEIAQSRATANSFAAALSRNRITQPIRQAVHSVAQVLLDTTHAYKLVVSTHTVAVYSDHTELFDQLESLGVGVDPQRRCAQVDRDKDVILLTNPQHTHRSYFRYATVTATEKANLRKFLLNQPDIRISPGLRTWFDQRYLRTQDYHFIDHNNTGELLLLSLVRSGLVRKTHTILPR